MRDAYLNTHYLLCFGQKRVVGHISALATLMFPMRKKKFLKVYKEVTSSHHYCLLKFTLETPIECCFVKISFLPKYKQT